MEVVLDGGPLIRAMAHPDSPPPRIGDRVAARWWVIDVDAQGDEVVEPAFAATEATRAVRA
ncbi:hypothetical protein A5669_05010 [Mycolicibacterium fortuitum]|uniref:hypothetical protein n=1 Tax=Mycolicibacterium fortuitum TaxID=1766 RepID=UPI0007E9BB20|nr:hypothetical protein [Mycolicibacterium fortuitum]OBG47678.1 hypothetical protein A5669_05010 [Mycolicibacterium fortuitum]